VHLYALERSIFLPEYILLCIEINLIDGRFRGLPLDQGNIEERDIDILVRVIISNELGLLLHDKPLASILQIRLKPFFLGGGEAKMLIIHQISP